MRAIKILTTTFLLFYANVSDGYSPEKIECIAPATPGGGFDLTCKLVQLTLLDTKLIKSPMKITFMPGGIGAVTYNTIIAQRSAEPGTIVAFSGGSLLNLAQGKFGRYSVNDVRWLATIGTDYGMIAVRGDSPYKTLKDLMDAFKKNPENILFGSSASIGSQDWMKTALLAKEAGIKPQKIRYVAFEGGGEPIVALLNNHVQAVSWELSETLPYLVDNKIRILAVYSDKRLEGNLASIPTAKEQGYNLVWPIIRGVYMGPDVSDEQYQWWVNIFNHLQRTDIFKKQREIKGLFEFNMTGKELDDYVKKQVLQYHELAKSFNLIK
ncbi:tripartite tricarboxylate transporter substrate binding protein [Xenorhabdus nematophila]|uniref:TctC protein n=1 Tax=Xenorhabdus nematophila (strain ATCC 19061 / DSM 3370 / CCUG 14189 / LMG 1036 / NCIMB 9965 / AN6) TaxID=406817 RepID=D3VKW7_XENNA|nr:tripartite tricarboxylate transporter substrate binding protein [Xenorhabdus nematophila]CEE94116.1 TctC protein [Xenorhabdus nematophila str. Anatoliense]CEF28545.1 TctC protein [Xenorhabdus nematophila str. Websteri]AYA39783.1 tripartite tricarboxylate transporter substrate binding protein [Xenorhabdus nematophila]KHD27739.1 tricarboxylic transport membrane protein [Xenorhabdus nematophila]MBA0018350.1 tripartite tricarboxylate transporter substrate binding protein [Xenorhabdus nematophil